MSRRAMPRRPGTSAELAPTERGVGRHSSTTVSAAAARSPRAGWDLRWSDRGVGLRRGTPGHAHVRASRAVAQIWSCYPPIALATRSACGLHDRSALGPWRAPAGAGETARLRLSRGRTPGPLLAVKDVQLGGRVGKHDCERGRESHCVDSTAPARDRVLMEHRMTAEVRPQDVHPDPVRRVLACPGTAT